MVPELARAARELSAIVETLATFPGLAADLARRRAALSAQLGFDPLDPKALAGAGLDPARGAALGREPPMRSGDLPSTVLVLPVGDASRLEALLARLARERLGAPERSASTQGEIRVVTFRTAPGAPPALSYALLPSERVAVLAPGPTGPEVALAALTRPAAESLAEAPAWRELQGALAGRYALLAAGVPPSPRLPAWARDGAALGASADGGVLRLGVAVRLGDRAEALRKLRGSGEGRTLTRWLAPDSALVARWDGDFAELGRHAAGAAGAHDREWLAAHGYDLQRDLFDLLAPGGAVAVSPSPRLDLSDLSDVALRADPLRLVRFEAVGEVKDEAAARRALARLPALAAALAEPLRGGGAARPAVAPGAQEATGDAGSVETASGEIAWRLQGKRLFLAGGPAGALGELLARAEGKGPGWSPPTKASAAALQGGLGGAVLSPRSLAASVRALPEETFGEGPTGFVVRSMVERFLEPAERLSAISARAELGDTSLVVELVVEVPPAAGKGAGR